MFAPSQTNPSKIPLALPTTPTISSGPISGNQHVMGTVVENAVDKAKGEIGSLIPEIENEIVKQEDELNHKLIVAEASLTNTSLNEVMEKHEVDNDDEEEAKSSTPELSQQQQMIGGMVEGAVDNAKGEIGSLMPKIEEKIIEQEEKMEGQLSKAEEGLVGESNNQTDSVPRLSATQKMMGGMVEGAVNKAKGEIGSLMPKIEEKIIEQEEKMEGQLSRAEEGLVGNSTVVKEAPVNDEEARPEPFKPKDYLPPEWHKDVVIDEEAGIALRMLDNKVTKQPL
jgi:hypothetical protein